MPRVNYVKHARARYAMVPKRGEDGKQIEVPVLRKDGTPKTTKHGSPITRKLTVQDRTKQLPPLRCGKCDTLILPGQPYKWIEPKMRGMMVRCADCPNWNVWEYSDSLSARVAQIQDTAANILSSDFDSPDDLRSDLEEIASEIRSLAEEKEEAASNLEEGFGHETYQSQEISEQADQLNDWADEIENVDIPDLPEPEEQDCEECEGTGINSDPDDDGCSDCDGAGTVTPDDPTDEQMDEWREEARQAAQDAVDNCPL